MALKPPSSDLSFYLVRLRRQAVVKSIRFKISYRVEKLRETDAGGACTGSAGVVESSWTIVQRGDGHRYQGP